MGKKNNAICSYLENSERFADFLNGSLYEGRQVISPEQIEENQTVYSKEARSRDILKKICRNLHDMLNFEKENEIFGQYIPNYQINLVTLKDLDENNFRTGIRELVAFLKRRTSKSELRKYCMENERRMQAMDEDTFETIGIMLSKSDFIERKENYQQEGGKLNMCKAMEEWGEDLRQEGREQGIKAFIWANIDEMVPAVRIVEKLQKYFGLDEESAQNYFVRYEKECLSTP